MRSCLVGTGLARAIDLAEPDVGDVFYISLLQHIGCTGYAHETFLVWRDDLAANRAAQRTNFADSADVWTAGGLALVDDLFAADHVGHHLDLTAPSSAARE